MKYFYPVILFCLIISCRKEKMAVPPAAPVSTVKITPPVPPLHPAGPKITSAEYIDSLLFVNKNNYQVQTTDTGAAFASTDPHITISANGLISRLVSAEVVAITVTWKNPRFAPTTIYVLGATDNNQVMPFLHYQGALATDAYAAYVQGWKTLQQLPDPTSTYAIILRHADASCGADCGNFPGAPSGWWKRTDSVYVRQLNQQGIDRATQLGQIFKDLNYPIKRVFTSEYYRARQTAALINAGPVPVQDSTINHPTHNNYAPGLFLGMAGILSNQPLDNRMTLIVAHHPLNELRTVNGYATFPSVTPFNWTGAYFVKVELDGTLTYHGAASWGMFKRWRDMKLKL
ncbi:MAG: histidine phosphatase family protein [Bacteroidota bacterium]|nr:histidine phosphatase family protein [Bacteroidota bacterium]